MAEILTRIVLRNDSTTAWANANTKLLKGEVGIEFDVSGLPKIKIGDGEKTWNELPYFGGEQKELGVYQCDYDNAQDLSDIECIARFVGENELNDGDFAVVRHLISEGHYQHTGYIRKGEDWVALDGNYDASNIYFSKDLIFTKQFGKYAPDSTGSVKIETKTDGMSLLNLLEGAFAEELNPTTTQPTITLSSSNIGSKEVGTKISIKYEFKDSTAGSYTYGPATGVTWSDYSATFNGETLSGVSGTFQEVQVGDSTSLSISGSAKHSAGATPVTNLGNNFVPETITNTSGAIQEKTVSKSKGTLTGYRKMFMGTMTSKPATLTSSDIRALTGISQAVSAVTDKEFKVPVGALRVICAVPSAYSVTACKDKNGFDTDLIATNGMLYWGTVDVEGVNNYTAATYDVWYQDLANANDTENTYKVTVKKDA